MSFYIMKQDTFIEGSASIAGVPDPIDPLEWIQGKPVPDPGNLVLDLSLESGDYRGHIIDGLITVYHEELKNTLLELGVDNVYYFPVTLRDQGTNELEGGYELVVIIGCYDCIDMKKSQIQQWRTGIGFDFLSMVIDESKTHGSKIFRLKHDPSKVIINEELKQYFEKTDMLAGVDIIRTEDYSD